MGGSGFTPPLICASAGVSANNSKAKPAEWNILVVTFSAFISLFSGFNPQTAAQAENKIIPGNAARIVGGDIFIICG